MRGLAGAAISLIRFPHRQARGPRPESRPRSWCQMPLAGIFWHTRNTPLNRPGSTFTMAPRLSKSQHERILSMILRGFSNKDIAKDVSCTLRALRRIRSTYARYGTTTMPANRTGPDAKITPTMGIALAHHLVEEPDLEQHEMVDFIDDKFEEGVTVTNIARALQRRRVTRKVMRRVAQQQKPELRHFYQYRLKMLGAR